MEKQRNGCSCGQVPSIHRENKGGKVLLCGNCLQSQSHTESRDSIRWARHSCGLQAALLPSSALLSSAQTACTCGRIPPPCPARVLPDLPARLVLVPTTSIRISCFLSDHFWPFLLRAKDREKKQRDLEGLGYRSSAKELWEHGVGKLPAPIHSPK